MKKVKNIFSSACKRVKMQKGAAAFSAAVFALTSVTCMFQLTADGSSAAAELNSMSSKEILQLSEFYLSPSPDSNVSVLALSDRFTTFSEAESETDEFIQKFAAESESETESEETTNEEVETIQEESTQEEKTEYTFDELGISQLSDIDVPDDILFDENGIPLNYAKKITGRSTAYSMGTTTATGTRVHEGVVAVNPKIIPYGSKMYIVASDGSVYGYSSAEDTGGFIYWNNAPIVDLYVYSTSQAYSWGNRQVTIYIF